MFSSTLGAPETRGIYIGSLDKTPYVRVLDSDSAGRFAAPDKLLTTMQGALRRDASIERAVVDAVECAVLAPHVGERFDGAVIDKNERGVMVQLLEPAVIAPLDADVDLGAAVRVVLAAVDPIERRVRLELAAT